MDSRHSLDAIVSVCAPVGQPGNGEVDERSSRSKRTILSAVDAIIEGEECAGQQSEKKKRLSAQQVRSLEKNFEVENKLEPDRKIQLAQELGLQPRQVAVWFQNRRARWKTKQLERDYGLLKANYDRLKSSYHSLQQDRDNLTAELTRLKEKLKEAEKRKSGELMVIDAPLLGRQDGRGEDDIDMKPLNRIALSKEKDDRADTKVLMSNEAAILHQDGSESDSSAVLNDNSPRPIDTQTSSLKVINPTTGCAVAAALTATADGNAEHGLMQTGENGSPNARGLPPKAIYQQFFRMDDSFECCGNFFANVDDHPAATLPWWESWT